MRRPSSDVTWLFGLADGYKVLRFANACLTGTSFVHPSRLPTLSECFFPRALPSSLISAHQPSFLYIHTPLLSFPHRPLS